MIRKVIWLRLRLATWIIGRHIVVTNCTLAMYLPAKDPARMIRLVNVDFSSGIDA